MNLPLLTTCPLNHASMAGDEPLGMSLICRPTNQSGKPPLDGVLLSWRSDHEISLIRRLQAASMTRIAHGRNTQRLEDMALSFQLEPITEPSSMTGKIGDGSLSHSLPLSQSRQFTH